MADIADSDDMIEDLMSPPSPASEPALSTPANDELTPVDAEIQVALKNPDEDLPDVTPLPSSTTRQLKIQVAALDNARAVRKDIRNDSKLFVGYCHALAKSCRRAGRAPNALRRVPVLDFRTRQLQQHAASVQNELTYHADALMAAATTGALGQAERKVQAEMFATLKELHGIENDWVVARKRFKKETKPLRVALERVRQAEQQRDELCKGAVDRGTVLTRGFRWKVDRAQGKVDGARTRYAREWSLMKVTRDYFLVDLDRLHHKLAAAHADWAQVVRTHLDAISAALRAILDEAAVSMMALDHLDALEGALPTPAHASRKLDGAIVYHAGTPPSPTLQVFGRLDLEAETDRREARLKLGERPPVEPTTPRPTEFGTPVTPLDAGVVSAEA
ncbi:hypothetical protein J8273_0298 [Carpediemonas membranifera]|uniref:Uncharacterized protein n=1 Tax=Carpediemonas membranifera TaxID=201153 RepID=A0A8J6BDA0_9EUKA|nr:hypothetical protein J8273_0298 [Carpediemonas membranifera]|eukprot:KAG9395082.1 hypothetical protein J8273_0298 [Carpediemonas membranifera]